MLKQHKATPWHAFLKVKKHNFLLALLYYALQAIRRLASNSNNKHGKIAQKTCRKYKLIGKNWHVKRKKGKSKKKFIKFPGRNTGKQRCDNLCSNSNNPKLIAKIERVGTSKKWKPNKDHLQVWWLHNNSINMHYLVFNYFRIMNSPSTTASSTNFNSMLMLNSNALWSDFNNDDNDLVISTVSKAEGATATSSYLFWKSNNKTKDSNRAKQPFAHEKKSVIAKMKKL